MLRRWLLKMNNSGADGSGITDNKLTPGGAWTSLPLRRILLLFNFEQGVTSHIGSVLGGLLFSVQGSKRDEFINASNNSPNLVVILLQLN